MLSFGVNRGVARYYAARLDEEGIPHRRFDVSTEPFSPFLWKLVVEDERHYHLARVNLFDLDRDLDMETHAKPPPEIVERLAPEISMLETFLWFARYPVLEIENSLEKSRLLFNDLRFFSTVGFLKRSSHNDNGPFALTIELDGNGKPLNWQYRRPRGAVVVHYLE